MPEHTSFEETILRRLEADVAIEQDWHPSLELLMDSLVVQLPAGLQVRLHAHAVRCTECRNRLQTLKKSSERALTDFRRATSPWTFAEFYESKTQRSRGGLAGVRRRVLIPALGTAACAVGALSVSLVRMFSSASGPVARGVGGVPDWPTWALLGAAAALAGVSAWLLLRRMW